MSSSAYEECFVVFIRGERGPAVLPEDAERELVRCATYQEARRIRDECRRYYSDCTIRHEGPVGGGD
jgi:hypothetical protein